RTGGQERDGRDDRATATACGRVVEGRATDLTSLRGAEPSGATGLPTPTFSVFVAKSGSAFARTPPLGGRARAGAAPRAPVCTRQEKRGAASRCTNRALRVRAHALRCAS